MSILYLSYNNDAIYRSLFGQPLASGMELISLGQQAEIVVRNVEH